MSLNILRFHYQGRIQWGVLRDQRIAIVPGEFATTGDFIRRTTLCSLAQLQDPAIDAADVTVLSPVTGNQQFLCQGANYRQHMIESGMDPDVKAYNMIFTKAPSCIAAAGADVVRPQGVRFLDYEIELGLILKHGINATATITEANLHDYVAGLVIVNDYSARDIQIPQMQFYKGKSFRGFGQVGPRLCLLEKADFAQLRNLQLELRVNGTIRQQDNTRNLVYGPAETLSELSGVHDLQAGDLLSTGTPAGCALSVPTPAKQRLAAMLPERKKWELFFKIQAGRPYLQPGDLVEASIRSADGTIDLGVQRNRVIEEV